MLLAGLWCSAKKPPITDCLTPIIEELEALATEGAYIYMNVYIVYCVLL